MGQWQIQYGVKPQCVAVDKGKLISAIAWPLSKDR